ncbi:MAG: antibiotic biosynthesis monooxygenase [Candidatus Dormibacteraeota bacterium]|nr:antibiotic biosynthesis monooxygenase [Candidatus Dormibacteraeota bacterium]
MYGTVARWQVKEGKEKELEQLSQELMREMPPGGRTVVVYRADKNPREYWVASTWESKEAYTSNSNTPEQDARFRKLRDLMDADPEWHDGEVVIQQG